MESNVQNFRFFFNATSFQAHLETGSLAAGFYYEKKMAKFANSTRPAATREISEYAIPDCKHFAQQKSR